MKDVLRIVCDYLVDHGYDGLCDTDIGCGCAMPDLAPCDGLQYNCRPAYNHPSKAKRMGFNVWMTPRKARRA
ncbi:MAG: hypothetical protein WC700_18365 [Gemmatimonadaceae bacterium]|jgi:hypothetical protein